MSSAYAPVVLFSGLFALTFYLYLSRRNDRLPPGPKPLPLLGNLFDIPVSHEYKTYSQWEKMYGDVVHISVLGKHIVVLSSFHAAHELLHGRSAIYSDRPFIPMLHESSLMDSNWTFPLMRYSASWRSHRRLFTQHLNLTASRVYLDTQTSSAHTLLRLMLHTPKQFAAHIQHAVGETMLAVAYGYQVQSTQDPYIGLAEYVVEVIGQGALPGRFLVNALPWLKYVPSWAPGTGFKAFAIKARDSERKLVKLLFEDAEQRIAQGTALPSFVTSALADPSPNTIIPDIQAVAAAMYGAGADTSGSTIHACLLALVLYPAVQVRAQAELDTVLGPVTSPMFRLPTFSDRAHLPYIDAIVKESLRWIPVAPIGIPHATTEQDVYRGWRIPKGTIVIANVWSMLHDEKTYTHPLEFRPERFLGENPEPDPGSRGCFGFGRRECPGSHLGESSVWIMIASLLAAFTLSPAKDEDGRDVDVSYASEPVPGIILHPQNFQCTIRPRSTEAELRIHETHPKGGFSW